MSNVIDPNKKIESYLFTLFEPSGETGQAFKDDLQQILTLDGQKLSSVVLGCRPFFDDDDADIETLLEQVANELGVTSLLVRRAARISQFFLSAMLKYADKGEAPDRWVADAITLGFLSEDEEEQRRFQAFSETIFELGNQIRPASRRQKYEEGVFPVLKSIGYTVEIRAVMSRDFDFHSDATQDRNVNDYVGVASFSLRTDEDEKLFFQLDRKLIKKVIRALEAAEADLAALECFVKKQA